MTCFHALGRQSLGKNPRVLDTYAFDRASVRSYDTDNRLHVASTNISKANICGYLGREIPNWQALGLDPETTYQLYRDPDEIEKAADTFNNLPLLSEHVPVSAANHRPDLVIGSTGTNATFDAPYLKNSLVIWPKKYIDRIETGRQKDLSSAYRYTADMTPGEVDGEHYDGVMRGIIGNHVALVEEGRAGPDVVVGDSAISSRKGMKPMATKIPRKGAVSTLALYAALKPLMAQDATIEDFHKLLDSAKAAPVPAKDAESLDDGITVGNASPDLPPANPGLGVGEDDAEGLSDDEEAQYQALSKRRKPAMDDADAPPPAAAPASPTPPDTGKVGKPAMDAALAKQKTEILTQMRDAVEAREFVRPYVGNLPMALDSADAILRAAATNLGVQSAKTANVDALRDLIRYAADKSAAKGPRLAQDSAATKSYAEMFPGAGRIKQA